MSVAYFAWSLKNLSIAFVDQITNKITLIELISLILVVIYRLSR